MKKVIEISRRDLVGLSRLFNINFFNSKMIDLEFIYFLKKNEQLLQMEADCIKGAMILHYRLGGKRINSRNDFLDKKIEVEVYTIPVGSIPELNTDDKPEYWSKDVWRLLDYVISEKA